MKALQWLHEARDFTNILDMGCGNAILSTVAATIWEAKVLAVDISEKALEDAGRNITAHGLDRQITLFRSDGFSDPLIDQRAPYDLIICNMLAEFTVETARQVQKYLAPGGICLLAGILAWKAEAVKTTYSSLGLEIVKEMANSSWQSYVMRHRGDTSRTQLSQNLNL